MVDRQLFCADCSLLRGRNESRGRLVITQDRTVFLSEKRGLFGLGQVQVRTVWSIENPRIERVSFGEEDLVFLDHSGVRVTFRFARDRGAKAYSEIRYALEVSGRMGKDGQFSMRNLMESYYKGQV